MSTAVTEKITFVSQVIRAEYLGTEPGEGMYNNEVLRHRYTINEKYGTDETFVVETTNAKGTVGAYMHYYYIQYWGDMNYALEASQELTAKAEIAAAKFREMRGYNQTWVLSQLIHKIEEHQQKANEALEKFYIYAEMARGAVKL
jgi:hypothetical protein